MSATSPIFVGFLRRLWRRLVIVRMLEWAGTAVLLACAAALVLLPISVWQGQAALMPGVLILCVGALCGAVYGIIRRPSVLDAAMEADQQLHLSDLLSTALASLTRGQELDAFHRCIVAVANDRCRRTPASAVLLRRWGSRRWGGVGLAVGMVLTLGLISSTSLRLHAGSSAGESDIASAESTTADTAPWAPTEFGALAVQHLPPADSGADRSTQPGMSETADTNTPGGDGSSATSGSPVAGTGSGAAQSQVPSQPATVRPQEGTGAGSAVSGQGIAGGAGSSQAGLPAGQSVSSGTSGRRQIQFIPPWSSSAWTADRDTAVEKIRSGHIPDVYRELVRDYFDREPAVSQKSR